MEEAKYVCSRCHCNVLFNYRTTHFEHALSNGCSGGTAIRKLRSEFHTPDTLIGEVIEVKDEFAAARPFTASAQIDPKPWGGPWLR